MGPAQSSGHMEESQIFIFCNETVLTLTSVYFFPDKIFKLENHVDNYVQSQIHKHAHYKHV